MTTTDIQKNIIPYLGEAAPYIIIPENIIFRDHKIETEIKNWNFENENFSHLVKLLFSLGSLGLYKLLNDGSREKIYFLGEKVRIRKLSFKEPQAATITNESILESDRKGKSYIHIGDSQSDELLYTGELDYYIVAQEAFELFYKDLHTTVPVEYHDSNLPQSKIINTEVPHHFTISTEPFTSNQCKGHFENYPIVPFAFIANCILKEIFNFLNREISYEIESLEGYASNALPTGITFLTEVFHQKYLKNLIYFKCEIKDTSGNSYGALIFNIKSKK
ncbi:hypothetical protein [Chryseobacterium viscerum]|uniref:Uncharacterized protein n=1 Tax=Chryseobacterium viscerum TaxID=1037377 RepID=A0A316WIV5_9FLAO|nr:hypothetical protein [Chryseobacterium viscerum]PWN59088.1 hypothetical protein C1634_021030 [Chryseobacterium viscerum]